MADDEFHANFYNFHNNLIFYFIPDRRGRPEVWPEICDQGQCFLDSYFLFKMLRKSSDNNENVRFVWLQTEEEKKTLNKVELKVRISSFNPNDKKMKRFNYSWYYFDYRVVVSIEKKSEIASRVETRIKNSKGTEKKEN